MNESLMARIAHLGKELEGVRGENAELEERNRDLGFFISGGERLRGLGVVEEELREGTVSLPEGEGGGKKGKGKKKGKK